MEILKNILNVVVPKKIKNFFYQQVITDYEKRLEYATISYSQEGEDCILDRIFNEMEYGFYVDIGAHHPKRFSNTNKFYKRGWRGINIDAMPNSMDAFKKERPDDINLEIGISKENRVLTYYMFNEPALNTFSKEEASKKDGIRNYKVIEEKKILTYSLKEVLDKYLINSNKIDFITIDVEGLDLEVIESNDWNRYRPKIVLVEDLKKHELIELPLKSDVYKFLNSNDYQLIARTFNTLFFKDNRI
ncbi:FkbM family methyltransferase [Flavivirga algicola]|uniref:FkbM family methyltransferase n=1 Tax=Flavivirga algicola TaxID=2729136 RepID=A0ABX1RV91_9FLAO|nr:FkbM family methyltransferase [Flavivirga algicola]NMH86362.1 FkbM family methyltransferase [Flavivirga algicola]